MQVDTSQYKILDTVVLNDSSTLNKQVFEKTAPSSFLTERPVKNIEVNKREKQSNDFMTILLLIGFILVAASNFLFRKRLWKLFQAFWARNYSNQLMREGNIFKEQLGLVLFVVFLISTPLFFSLSVTQLLPSLELKFDIYLPLLVLAFLLTLWGARIFFVKTTSILFNTPKPSFEILLQIFIFNLVSGIIVLPFSILFYYSGIKLFLIIGVVLWSFIQLYRFIRLYVVGFSYSIFSGLHLFLYLCTLEILPIVILLEIIKNYYLYLM